MPKAVQLSAYGALDQLAIVDVPKPVPAAGEVVVRVVAAGTNPGEIAIREGFLKDRFPKTFPFGQLTDFAGYVMQWARASASSRKVMRCSAGRTNGRRKPSTLVLS